MENSIQFSRFAIKCDDECRQTTAPCESSGTIILAEEKECLGMITINECLSERERERARERAFELLRNSSDLVAAVIKQKEDNTVSALH